jgi:hypothetical protein
MALLDFFMGIQDPVVAEYRITKVSKPSTTSSVASCDMVGEVTAPGMTPRTIAHNSPFASIEKWPRVGDVLPVLIDRVNPEFMRIQWKQIPEHT